MEDPCEALDQEVVGLAVVDWTGGPWVSHGGVAGGLLSSQMASELLLAARNVRFPNKVQLVQGWQAWSLPGEKCPGGHGAQSTPRL